LLTDDRPVSQSEYLLDLRKEAPEVFSGHLSLGGTSPDGETLAFTNYYMTRNNHPCMPVMGEFHLSRFPRQYWAHELRKMQAGGIQIIATYIFWIHVEEDEGVFSWSENNDIRSFVQLCQALGLHVILRIGPFAHGECRNGGLPDWLYSRSFVVRSNDEGYLSYVRRYYGAIAGQINDLLFKDGGPIIGVQIENEYMHTGAPWEVTFRQGAEWVPSGSDGNAHMLLLREIALAAGLQVPIYSCTGWLGSPVPKRVFLPMQGGYAFTPWNPDPDFQQQPTREFLFRDRHQRPLSQGEASYDAKLYPYASCELGSGIQITYHHRPIVPAEAVQAMAIIALGSGANMLGYYMYHGGSNPVGKHAYLNEFTVPRISYDFQAPIGEFGQIQPSYHRLRMLHLFLQDFERRLAPMAIAVPQDNEYIEPENTDALRYTARSKDGSGFLFINNYQDHVAMQDHQGVRIRLDLTDETLLLPRIGEGLRIDKNVSAILPFNLRLDDGILLKYATAQLLTKVSSSEETGARSAYVFFAPEGMQTEFALDRTTYGQLDITGGTVQEEDGWSYVTVGMGLAAAGDLAHMRVQSLKGEEVEILVLSEEEAHRCWKLHMWGRERLVFSDALVLWENDRLSLYWRGEESANVAIYPPLTEDIKAEQGQLARTEEKLFTRFTLTLPEYKSNVTVQQLHADTIALTIPTEAREEIQELFIRIDYLGDMGHGYLEGQLVSDHFANGLPWEIGLKRFIDPDNQRELILHFSPLRQNARMLRYFPTGMAFKPGDDGYVQIEIRSITVIPEYHGVIRRG
jgi:beta-galactosidase